MTFKDPWLLLLAPLVVVAAAALRRRRRPAAVRFSSIELVAGLGRTARQRWQGLPWALRLTSLAVFVVALAGPRKPLEESKVEVEGIDIVLAIDVSGSMMAEDFTIDGRRANRLEAVKRVVGEFIDGRPHDRIGLVAFAARAYVVSPLTLDADWLKANLERVTFGLIKDGTAIGSAITASLARLHKSRARSKVIILLTDGVNNAGRVSPIEAAEAARALGVKIYTIGAGTRGYAPIPVRTPWGRTGYIRQKVEIDEDLLIRVAEITGGRYFRATDTASLREIYRAIDTLEKTKIEEKGYRDFKELFPYAVFLGLALLAVEGLLSQTILLRIP